MEAAVKARGLIKDYGTLRAVAGIDFELARGEYFGILGPNGAGKTTTVGMIYCFLPVDGGTLTVLGHDVRQEPRAIKARLGVVPQENNLDLELSVINNLLVYASYFGIPKAVAQSRAFEQLEFFGLAGKKDTEVEKLSGGMKRRLTIARGLINNPDILILDEPTTGLDPEARHHIWQHLKHLKKNGLTVILTTHYLEEASLLCDRLMIMDEGRILDTGTPAELVARHVGKYALEVGLAAAEQGALPAGLYGLEYGHLVIGETVYLYPGDALAEVARQVAGLPGVIYRTERPANLEDVFLKLTGRRFGGRE